MTFTLIARNPFTRQIGLAMASGSDDCIGGSLAFRALTQPQRPVMIVVQGKSDPHIVSALEEASLQGRTPHELMEDLRAHDSALPLRQVMMASFDHDLIVQTGAYCGAWAGHISEEHLLVAGNLLSSSRVLREMRKAYLGDLYAPMRRRLLAALRAGVAAGGDLRGHASAGIMIVGEQPFAARVTASHEPLEVLDAEVSGR
jgi:uncharacterized Ntn-hydrolase superfamily protein